jgi:plastocyanin domain-containing protein
MNKIIVIIIGALGILMTYWFFLMKKDRAVNVSGSVDILVKGGFTPDVINIPVGKTTKLFLTRTDPSSCLEEFVLPDFKIRKYLPMNEKVGVEITPAERGIHPFSCGMNMFHGKIIVI